MPRSRRWWIFVPSTNTKAHANKHSAANNLLLAQQAESDKLHRRDDYEDRADAAIDDDAWVEEWEEVEDEDAGEEDEEEELARLVKRKKHHKKAKKAKKTKKVSKGKTDGK